MNSSRPKLIRNCRLSTSAQSADLLLMPEGAIRLKGTASEIIGLCDGKRTVDEILATLKRKYPVAETSELESDTLEFLNSLHDKRVIDFLDP